MSPVRTTIGVVLLSVASSCHQRLPTTRYRVAGVVPETWSAGLYRSAEVGDILDSHGDSLVLRRYGSMIKSSPYAEQTEALKLLIRDIPTPYMFRRVVETRRGLKSLRGFRSWLGDETMQQVKRVEMEALITRERVVQDLSLVERTLNVASHVDDDYESLRRAVVLDSEQLQKSGTTSASARFWFCQRGAEARSFRVTLLSNKALFSEVVVDSVRSVAEAWLRQHLVDARVTECRSLSAGDTLVIRFEGMIGIRVDMLPILAARDGTLMLISDPAIRAASVYR